MYREQFLVLELDPFPGRVAEHKVKSLSARFFKDVWELVSPMKKTMSFVQLAS